MKIKFIKGTYTSCTYNTDNLFRVIADANKLHLLGRNGELETIILPEGVGAHQIVEAITIGMSRGNETIFVFYRPDRDDVEIAYDNDELSFA